MNSDVKNHTVGIVLYSGFELLDVFGPAEMFGVVSMLPGLEGAFELVMVAERGRECVSA